MFQSGGLFVKLVKPEAKPKNYPDEDLLEPASETEFLENKRNYWSKSGLTSNLAHSSVVSVPKFPHSLTSLQWTVIRNPIACICMDYNGVKEKSYLLNIIWGDFFSFRDIIGTELNTTIERASSKFDIL